MDEPGGAPVAAGNGGGTSGGWKRTLYIAIGVLGSFLAVCWILVIYDAVVPKSKSLVYHGLMPRTTKGLLGIITMPFLHIGFSHVATDSAGILLLGGLLIFSGRIAFGFATAFVWLVGNFFLWCVGPDNVYIVGTGGVCFGWFAYLMITPFFVRPINVRFIVIAVITGILYGGLIFGFFSSDSDVSWVGSVCGLVAGIICSLGYWYGYRRWFHPKFIANRHLGGSQKHEVFVDESGTAQAQDNNTGVILPTPQKAVSPAPKRALLQQQEQFSPFGPQEPAPQQNSFEPSWMNTGAPAQQQSTTDNTYRTSNNPTWMDTSPKEMNDMASPTTTKPNTQWNPFE